MSNIGFKIQELNKTHLLEKTHYFAWQVAVFSLAHLISAKK